MTHVCEIGAVPFSALPGVNAGDLQDSTTHFDFSPCILEHLQEEEPEIDKWVNQSASSTLNKH